MPDLTVRWLLKFLTRHMLVLLLAEIFKISVLLSIPMWNWTARWLLKISRSALIDFVARRNSQKDSRVVSFCSKLSSEPTFEKFLPPVPPTRASSPCPPPPPPSAPALPFSPLLLSCQKQVEFLKKSAPQVFSIVNCEIVALREISICGLLQFDSHSISISNLNRICLFATERGKRDLENKIIKIEEMTLQMQ